MKANEIKVGGLYKASISGKIVTVRVDAIRDTTVSSGPFGNKTAQRYDVTNLTTNHKTTFKSAAKFRSEVKLPPNLAYEPGEEFDPELENQRDFHFENERIRKLQEGEQSSDPSKVDSLPLTTSAGSLGSRLKTILDKTPTAAPHLIVVARAGTGKTTTLVEGLKVMKGLGTAFTPSPQQAAIWEQMKLSADARTICFVAFNKSIATELQARVPQGCDAMTMHSMGFRAVTKALGRQEPNDWVVKDMIAEILAVDLRSYMKTEKGMTVISATEKLVSLCKQNLIADPNETDLDELSSYYGIELNGSKEKVYELVPKILERCKTPKGKITFDDMIWLPVILDLPIFQYDLLLVDEAQDLNRCQQALARKAGCRLILCGDDRQAIYGFAGADAQSMTRMAQELGQRLQYNGDDNDLEFAPGLGCATLPLTVTRRCGKAIVEEARKLVPDFEAHEDNGEGSIRKASMTPDKEDRPSPDDYRKDVSDGDMILCRINAPLVSECFRFIRQGRKANIQGRDVGKGLISTVQKLKAANVADLIGKLGDWLADEQQKEQAKRHPSENRLNSLQDRHDCLLCFTEGLSADTHVDFVISKIDAVFTDNKNAPGIRLSSIHKAKGLESRRVFYLRVMGGPREDKMQAWERQQESNLRYVAITRAIEELVYVIEE